jgi:uncharacterized protein
MTMEEQCVEVKGAHESFARGDVAAVLGPVSDDLEWHEAEGMPYGRIHRRGAAIAENVLGPIIEHVFRD